jgi:hypothetical protein
MGLPSFKDMGLIINCFRVVSMSYEYVLCCKFSSILVLLAEGSIVPMPRTFWFFLCILEFLKSEEGAQKQNNKKNIMMWL